MKFKFTRYFSVAWGGCFLSFLIFDLLWSMETAYRQLTFFQTYLYAAMMAMLMAIPALMNCRRWVTALIMVAMDTLMIANLMYCRTYFIAIPPASYLLAGNVAEFTDSIFHSIRPTDFILYLIVPLTLRLMGKRKAEKPRWHPYILYLGIGVLASGLLSIKYGSPIAHVKDLKRQCYYRAAPPVVYTLPISIIADLTDGMRPVSEEEKTEARDWLISHGDFIGEAPQFSRVPENLVLIIVESLEGWPIGKTVEGQEITPTLNRFIADTTSTWVATRVQSQVGSGRSIEGQLLMTCGLHPDRDYVYSMRFPEHNYPHLSKALKAAGVEKSYFLSGDRATAWNQGAVMRSFEVDQPLFRDQWKVSEYFGHTRNPSDGSLFRQIISKMQSGDIWPAGERAMIEIVTYSGHYPFTIPEEKRNITLTGKYPALLKEYIESVNYTDGAIGELLDYLRSRPDWVNTMVVVVGDHEGIASYRKDMRAFSAEMSELVDPGLFIPMVAINAPVGGEYTPVMGQVDVYSTILDMMGVSGSSPEVTPGNGKSSREQSFAGMGISALRPQAPGFAIDLYGNLAGDTIGVDPQLFNHLQAAPAAASTIIRADLLK